MPLIVLVKLVGCVVTAVLASAILSRDSGIRVNRLMATILAGTAFWSLCEVLGCLEPDPDRAVVYVRLSCLGWVWLGPAVYDVFLELGDRRSRLRAYRGLAYLAAVAAIPLHLLTPWSVASVVATDWGWSFRPGPLFAIPYAAASFPPLVVLVSWRQVYPWRGSEGEQLVSKVAFASVAVACAITLLTDALLPALELGVPTLGSTAISIACVAIAWTLHRYGYSLVAPRALADEILARLSDGVAILEPDGTIRASNEAVANLVGVDQESLEGLPVASLLPEFTAGRGSIGGPIETVLCARNGESVAVSVTSTVLYHERGGHPLGEAVVIRDLRDLVVLRDRLVTSGRLAAVGELSTSIAHEIRDPIADVQSHLTQLRLHWQGVCTDAQRRVHSESLQNLFAEGEELVEECLEGVDRVSAIVRDVGGFSRGAPDERVLSDLDQILTESLHVARVGAPVGVTLSAESAEIPKVWCNPAEVQQVLLNLLVNAVQAVGESGQIHCRSEADAESVRIYVSDDGPGIPAEATTRIFDPFFTTKPVGEGTGLGLAISYQIVRAYGGDLRVESVPGEGATFTIELPAASDG